MGKKQNKHQEKEQPTDPPSEPAPVAAPATKNSTNEKETNGTNGTRISTLLLLLFLNVILSSVLSPFIQDLFNQVKHTVFNKFAEQTTSTLSSLVKLQPRSEGLLDPDTYVCKHSYRINIVHRDPLIMMIDDFLQPGEAEHMIAVAKPKMVRSGVFGEKKYHESRTSSSAYLEKSEDHVMRCIEERASQITNIPVNTTEALQVVWYTKGQEFRPHYDYLSPSDLMRSRYTYLTMLAYLNEPEEGGGTTFPKLNLEFAPKRNAALVWYNVGLDEKEDPRTLHGGAPVIRGEKYAINIWQRKMIPHVQEILRKRQAQKAKQNTSASASQTQSSTTTSEPKQEL
jgi:prolyl 4-hydroxylase